MQHQKKKPGKADKAMSDNDRTPENERQEGNELFVDGSQRLDEEDVKENDITGSAAGNEDEENRKRQGIDKAPGEEQGKSDKVTGKDLKGKQVDADPSGEEGKPLNS